MLEERGKSPSCKTIHLLPDWHHNTDSVKIAVWFFLALNLAAIAEPSVPVHDSESPDGRFALVIVPNAGDEGASGTIRIRNIATQKLSGAFEWAGFGSRVAGDSISAVLWSADSHYFALSWPKSRGYTGCAIYGQFGDGWMQVPLPDYMSQIFRRNKVIEGLTDKGCETPRKWTDNSSLRIEVANRGIAEPGSRDSMQHFWVTVGVKVSRENRRPVAILKSIELAPASAYQR